MESQHLQKFKILDVVANQKSEPSWQEFVYPKIIIFYIFYLKYS